MLAHLGDGKCIEFHSVRAGAAGYRAKSLTLDREDARQLTDIFYSNPEEFTRVTLQLLARLNGIDQGD